VVDAIAEIKGVAAEEVRTQTWANAVALFNAKKQTNAD
jgi:Tat protein secretion system quality control protein TatD with DNase activity